MNVVFLSPDFPPNYWHFCDRLHRRGATVLGIGEARYHDLRPELAASLTEYYSVPDLEDADLLLRACGHFVHRYGRLDRIDSHSEHWLGREARLREDFNIPGQRPADVARNRGKRAMKAVFREAGIPHARGRPVEPGDETGLREFTKAVGFPVILKPDVGVGAAGTIKLGAANDIAPAMERIDRPYLAEEFIHGVICSYDGLADRDGDIALRISHEYSSGVMEILRDRLDFHYFSHRVMDPVLEDLGRRVVRAFRVRERFFHVEFFRLADGSYRVVEINVRPPGGFTLDMMNYALDADLYDEWAALLTGGEASALGDPPYHACNVSRRDERTYRHSDDEIATRLGARLMYRTEFPTAFRDVMGDHAYIIRTEECSTLREDIAFIEALRD